MTRIDSPANARIAAALRAVAAGGRMLLVGRRVMEFGLVGGMAGDEVLLVQQEASEEHEDSLRRIRGVAPRVSLHEVSIRVLKRISDLPSTRGIAALAPPPHRTLTQLTPSKKTSSSNAPRRAALNSSLFLLLDGVQDPANVGAIVRSAEAFGAAGVVATPGCAWPFSPRALRASAGSALRVPIAARVAASDAVAWARRAGAVLAGAEAHGGDPPESAAAVRPLVLVIGSEGHGISPDLAGALDRRLTLPLSGRVDSLNAAVAAGLLLFVLTRR